MCKTDRCRELAEGIIVGPPRKTIVPNRAHQAHALPVTFWILISDQIGRRGGSSAPNAASRLEGLRVPGGAPVAQGTNAALSVGVQVYRSTYIRRAPNQDTCRLAQFWYLLIPSFLVGECWRGAFVPGGRSMHAGDLKLALCRRSCRGFEIRTTQSI